MIDENEIERAFTDAYYQDKKMPTFDVDILRNMRTSALYGTGETNRKKFCAELTPKFAEGWKEFVEVFTGIEVKHGRGSVSSPLVQLALELFMAIIADLDRRETIDKLLETINNPSQIYDIQERLKIIAEELRHGIRNK